MLTKQSLVLFFCLFLCSLITRAQEVSSPYYLSFKRELVYMGLSGGAAVTGFALHQSVDDVMLSDISLPDISGIDKWAPQRLATAPSDVSDVLLFSSVALPVVFMSGSKTRRDIGTVGVLYVEAMLLNVGITDIVKTVALRPRPYVLEPDLEPATILERNDRSSFFSGHTSVAATSSFFCARVFADYYPNSRWKPYVWAGAAVAPAVMGYLRIRAGKHYPSDVLTGYLLGGAIGYLIPTLHKRPVQGRRLNLSLGFGGGYLRWEF